MGESIPVTSNTIDANVREADRLVTAYVAEIVSRGPKDEKGPTSQNTEVSDSNTQPPAPSA